MKFNKFVSLTLVCSLITTVGGCSIFEKKPDLSEEHFIEALENVGATEIRKSEIHNRELTQSLIQDGGYYFKVDSDDEYSGDQQSSIHWDTEMEYYLPFPNPDDTDLYETNPTNMVFYRYNYCDQYCGGYNIKAWHISFNDADGATNFYSKLIDEVLDEYVTGRRFYSDYDLSEELRDEINDKADNHFSLRLRAPREVGKEYTYVCYVCDCDAIILGVESVLSDNTDDIHEDALDGFNELCNALSIAPLEEDEALIDANLRPRSDMLALRTVTIPDGVEYIADESFWPNYYEFNITQISMPDSVIKIGDKAFMDLESLSSVDISDSLINIGDEAFAGCDSLSSITLPDGLLTIGEEAFESCTSLTNLIIPDSVNSIGDNAFIYCTSLTSIVIPENTTDIGSYLFIGCESLESINGMDPVEWAESHGYDPQQLGINVCW